MPGEIVAEGQPVSVNEVSVGEFAEKFLLVHVVLEGFPAINENYRDLVVVLAAESGVSVDIDLLPGEAAAARELVEALFDHLTQMAPFARVDHDAARF
jgi:hypothetical protein